jgi:ubiquinone/menaquinone biosynthesis C-methylase UbiE
MSTDYVLGSHPDELARLEAQAASIEQATRLLLQAAGIGPGMRVLDLGSGLGHVSELVASLVGPDGSVVGVEQSPELLEAAERRRADAALDRVSFVQGDARTFVAGGTFDAVVGRLILFHLADPPAVVRHHLEALRPGGTVAIVDFDIGAARIEPGVPQVSELIPWIEDAFSSAGAHPRIGARLARILQDAGLEQVESFGLQRYYGPDDPRGPALLASVLRSLAPAIVSNGIATEEELDLPTLEQRIHDQLVENDAVLLPPTVAGAWGRRG